MHETPEDLKYLQQVLDASHENAGEHLKSIFSEEYRVPAEAVPKLLSGVQVLHLATVTSAGEPRVAPVDGVFYRGRFWFGSADTSLRFKHIRKRPKVSCTVSRGERFAVVVHGQAVEVDTKDPELEPFVECLREVYDDWDDWAGESPYAQILPERMFTFAKPISG